MFAFLLTHWGTILICAVLLAVVVLIVCKLIRDKRRGKSSCGCGCDHCPNASACHCPPKTVSSDKRAH